MAAGTDNTAKKKKSHHINVGMIIFLIIFLYIVFSVYSYFGREQIGFYEVVQGSIVRQQSYEGFAIREERAINADSSGYIHFYIPEGQRAAAKSNVYTIDETGALEGYLSSHPELSRELGREELMLIRQRLSSYSQRMQDTDFSSIYELKSGLDATMLEFSGIGDADNLELVLSQLDISYHNAKAPSSGVLSYTVDGYEGLGIQDIDGELFKTEQYQKRTTRAGELVEGGTAVYKLISSPEWSIVFPVSQEDRARLQDVQRLGIRFLSTGERAEAELSMFSGKDNAVYARLSLNTLMERYAGERYIQFEIINKDRVGLKLPLSSVIDKEFYTIPRDFLRTRDGTAGFLRRNADGSGYEFVETEIYRIDERYCYLNIPADQAAASGIKTNDILVKEEGSQSYSVGPTKALQGVYNINKGYCVFRQVIAVEQNESYMIAEENTDYGITVYDHIVLNASMVQEGQLIYR